MSRQLRVGVVGAGWWSTQVHLPAIARNPDARVVGIVDLDVERARAAAELFDVPSHGNTVDDLLALDVEAAIISTPHDAHVAPAARLLAAGVDVLVEKPLALDPVEAWQLVDLARENGAHLHVGYTYIYSPHAARVRELIRRGDLGDLVMATGLFASDVRAFFSGDTEFQRTFDLGEPIPFVSRPDTYASRARGGGQLQTQVTHAASYLLWCSDLQATKVAAAENTIGLDVDLVDSLTVSTTTGAVLGIASTGSVLDSSRRMEEYRLFGTEGHLVIDTHQGLLTITPYGREPRDEPQVPEGQRVPLDRPSQALVDTALGRSPVLATGELGARTVEVLNAAARSVVSGQATTIGRWS